MTTQLCSEWPAGTQVGGGAGPGRANCLLTPCWRPGCTLMMRNGVAHAGICNVILDGPRRHSRGSQALSGSGDSVRSSDSVRRSTFSLINMLVGQPDLLGHICGTHLSTASLLALEATCHQLRTFARGEHVQRLIWRQQFARRFMVGTDNVKHLESSQDEICPSGLRVLFSELDGPLEVKGWPDAAMVPAGENHAWWRCTAVGLRYARNGSDGRPSEPLEVLVHYTGYTSADDEWRELTSLRRHSPEAALAADISWRRRLNDNWYAGLWKIRPSSSVEVSWAVPGHPACWWEGCIIAGSARRVGRSVKEAKGVTIRFKGFDEADDLWYPIKSRKLRPACRGSKAIACTVVK